MATELHNNRIVNGLLKADVGLLTPEEVKLRLSQDVLIVVDPVRTGADDLWPCIWFLAAILERQFFGKIFIRAALAPPPKAPANLGPRCSFVSDDFISHGIVIGIGTSTDTVEGIWGDCRGGTLGYQSLVDGAEMASPITCCALAGYLGFAALAHAAGIPSFHEHWTRKQISIDLPPTPKLNGKEIGILGAGQIGQAFLSLGFFLAPKDQVTIHLVDDDSFEIENYRSQLLLEENSAPWLERPKVEVLAALCSRWGWNVTKEKTRITWGWKTPLGADSVAFLGFDNMEARRVGVEGGFAWLVECGVGTEFARPRVSWHSLPPSRKLANQLFPDPTTIELTLGFDSDFLRQLDETPGGCGRVMFENIQATAPCLGALAAGHAWRELCSYFAGVTDVIVGGAYVWSPLQPLQRDVSIAEETSVI